MEPLSTACDDNCTQNAYLFVFVYAHCFVIVGPLSRDLTRHLEVPHSLPSHSGFFSPRAGPSLPPQLFPAAVEPGPPHRGLVCKSFSLPWSTSRLAVWDRAASQAHPRGSCQGSACRGGGGGLWEGWSRSALLSWKMPVPATVGHRQRCLPTVGMTLGGGCSPPLVLGPQDL